MKTRKEAEDRSIELYPKTHIATVNQLHEVSRQSFLQCFDEMQANKQTCGFCVEPKEEQDYSDEEIKAMIDRMNEHPLQLIDTGCDQLRQAAENVVRRYAEKSVVLHNEIYELQKALLK